MTRWIRDGYELLLVAAAGFLLLVPVHQATLDHRAIDQTLTPQKALIDGRSVAVGDVFPVYRFHEGWPRPIGHVRVANVLGDDAVIVPDGEMTWPLGRHGRVVTDDGASVVVDVGSAVGFEVGTALGVYDGRRWIGDVVLTEVDPGRSVARKKFRPDVRVAGAPVTEFTVMTQVVVPRDTPATLAAQIALAVGPALVWLAVRLWTRRSPLELLGDSVRAGLGAGSRRAIHALLEGVFAGVLVGKFAPSAFTLIVSKVFGTHWWPAVEPYGDHVFAVVAASAAVYVAVTGRSALGALAELSSWRRAPVAHLPEPARRWILWALHLAIVYAFGSTLFGFFVTNVRMIAEIVVSDHTLGGAVEATKLTLWSATILACVYGYGHAVLGPLFGKHLRNLDFTIPGWVTNAACYGPLLGVAMGRVAGPRIGLDPVIAGGFVEPLLLALGLAANAAYTASIWNMGSRFGVMADKGLVDHGFYAVVRHPSYTLESLMFVLIEVTGYTLVEHWVAGFSIAWLYWLRSEREDQFLTESNPEYAAYRERVPWRYVPGIW